VIAPFFSFPLQGEGRDGGLAAAMLESQRQLSQWRGRKFAIGEQRPAVIGGDLALTSTRLPDGTVTAEVARRQADGTWCWVIDKFIYA